MMLMRLAALGAVIPTTRRKVISSSVMTNRDQMPNASIMCVFPDQIMGNRVARDLWWTLTFASSDVVEPGKMKVGNRDELQGYD